MNHLKRHLSVANVLSCMALFVALSGVAYAATLGKNAVKTRNLAKGAVTTQKLRNGAVAAAKLRNGAVTGVKIATGAVGSTQLADGGVRSGDLGGGVVTSGKLKDGAVTEEKIANSAVTSSKLAANAVTAGKIQEGAVTGAKLAPSFFAQLVKDVSYVTKTSETNTTAPKSITAECPAGKQVTGGGARIILGTAEVVAVTESAPFLNAEGKRTGWVASARTIPPDPGTFAVEAYAICAEF